MDMDLLFIVGVLMGVFAIPSLVSALTDRRLPKMAAFMVAIAVGMIYYANRENPDVYSFETVPDIFVNVVGRYLN